MNALKDLKVFFTGGAGFIGSHAVEELLKKEAQVTVFDNFSTGRKENLQHLSQNKHPLKVIKGDILNQKVLLKETKNSDLVFHFAAELEIAKGIEDPTSDLKTNALGTLNVLEAMRKNDIDNLVYASSAGVYGQAQYLPQDENHPLNPQWPYGVSKLAGETYCKAYCNLYSLRIVSLRYSIVYGPREWYRRVLTKFIKRVLEKKPPIIFGDGQQTRDFVHVKDAVDATLKATTPKAMGHVFNVGSGVATSINELAEIVIKCTGKKMNPIYKNPKLGKMGRKLGELVNLKLDITKAKKMLDYEPSINLEEGIRDFIEWARLNMQVWWKGKITTNVKIIDD